MTPNDADSATPRWDPDAVLLPTLRTLRESVPLTGSLVATGDGLLVAHNLPPHLEPATMAALAATLVSLSVQVAGTAHGGEFNDVVVHGAGGCVALYRAGGGSLTVLAAPDVNVGRLHWESRPAAAAIADLLASLPAWPEHAQAYPTP
ncbi:MAG: hypothetical protein HOQ24_01040 [Mycobacteriaceae bacterium]|nr:hypothetical protein [Mycobacteriaceae bacterium]